MGAGTGGGGGAAGAVPLHEISALEHDVLGGQAAHQAEERGSLELIRVLAGDRVEDLLGSDRQIAPVVWRRFLILDRLQLRLLVWTYRGRRVVDAGNLETLGLFNLRVNFAGQGILGVLLVGDSRRLCCFFAVSTSRSVRLADTSNVTMFAHPSIHSELELAIEFLLLRLEVRALDGGGLLSLT